MKIRLLLFLWMTLFSVNLNSQEKEDEKHRSVKNMLFNASVKEGRTEIIQALKNNNKAKVEQIRNELLLQEDTVSLAFFDQEKILLHFWLNEFEPLTYLIHQPPAPKDSIINWPPYDTLYYALLAIVGNDRFDISYRIQKNPVLSSEEKDFLLLALGYFIGEKFESQEKINEAADRFLENYSESEYRYVVENSFRQIYYPTKSKFSASVYIGNNTLEGDMNQLFRDHFAIGFKLAYYYQNYFLRINTSWGFTSPRRDILLNDRLWERNQSSSMTQFESSIGYVFFADCRLSILPFAGIGTTSFAPMSNTVEGEEYFEGVRFKAKFTNYAGIGLRYNIQKQNQQDKYFVYEDQSYSYLKFEYRFANPFMDRSYTGMGGRTHLISLTYGWFLQPVTDKKPK